jgi:D-xylose 1-dehydrogenase (NADP+, D-xylono-1,5-lactone-forming)
MLNYFLEEFDLSLFSRMSSEQPRVRLGLMSTAAVTRHLLSVVKSLSIEDRFVSVHAVSSRDYQKASEFAALNHIPNAYGTHEALLANPDVDAVYITMPNHVHAEWIVRALEANKHVLCEKPMVLTEDEAALVGAAHARCVEAFDRPLIVMEAVMSLYTPQTAMVEKLLADGAIGEVQYMRGIFQYNMTRASFRSGPSCQGGGSLWDVGCYPVYLARHLLGQEPVQCAASAIWSSHESMTRYDQSFSGLLTFPGGSTLQFCSSLHTPFGSSSFELHGTKGSIILPNPFKPVSPTDVIILHQLQSSDGGAPKVDVRHMAPDPCARGASHPYEGELRAFCALVCAAQSDEVDITRSERCPTDLAFGLGQARCMESLHRAAATQSSVALAADA